MNYKKWLRFGVAAIALSAVLENRIAPDWFFLGAAAFSAATGIIGPDVAFNPCSNSGMCMLAFMLVASASLMTPLGCKATVVVYVR